MNKLSLLVVIVVAFIAGCAGKSGTIGDEEFGGSAGGFGSDTWGDEDGASGNGSAIPIGDDRSSVVMNERVIYFAYDSADIDSASIEVLRQHGRYLADNAGETVVLEGHADERGSREYNIGLGEKRAVSVKQVLMVNGASEQQLVTVSYGEERPAELASSEQAWQLNRRVELVYDR